MLFRSVSPLLSLLIASCGLAPQPSLPKGDGPGLVAFDADAPVGAMQWQRPQWEVGDTFTLLRGGKQRVTFTVAEKDESGYRLVDDSGNAHERSLDLAMRAEFRKGEDEPSHELTPEDVRFHWPLWVGKSWTCRYVDRTAGGPSLPIETVYVVEDLDRVSTPAGAFDALRIVRRSRRCDADGFLDRCNVIWYAPSIGSELRQALGDTVVELVAYSRQEPAADAAK
jgi:hypothetical protein